MRSVFRNFQRHISSLLFLLIFLFLAVTLAGFIKGSASGLGSVLMMVGWLGALATTLLLAAVIGRGLHRPLDAIIQKVRTFADTDTAGMAVALTAVAQGDLTQRFIVQTTPVPAGGTQDVAELAAAVNSLIERFHESADGLNELTLEPLRRLCYVGPDSYQEGRKAGSAVAQAMSGVGELGILTINKGESGVLGLRIKGLRNMLGERHPGIQVVEIAETLNDPDRTRAVTREMLQKHPHLTCLYSTAAAGTDIMARVLQETGAAGRVKIVCHDIVSGSIELLERGIVAAIIGQDALAQGHDPVIHLFNHLAAGWTPPRTRMLTHVDIVTRENFHSFWNAGQGLIESEETLNRRAKPSQRSARPLRLAVLNPGDHEFWRMLETGVQAAARELRPLNAVVECLHPEGADFDRGIRDGIAAGYDGIAVPIFSKALVEAVNRAVDSRVAIVTFNSEPTSLRALMAMLALRSERLLSLSQQLADTAQRTGEATGQSARTVQQMTMASTNEAIAVSQVNSSVQRIADSIADVARGAGEQTRAAERVSAASEKILQAVGSADRSARAVASATAESEATAQRGNEAVRDTLEQMRAIREAVASSAETVREMSRYSQQIGEILVAIKEIADQTNLLALNAAIEAARAGEMGKGFAVVADEVRKLAERSASATKEIGGIVTTVQQKIDVAAEKMETVRTKVEGGSELAISAGQALDRLLESAQTVRRQADSLVESNASQSSSMSDLGEAIQQVMAVTEENFAVTHEISDSIKQVVGSVENVAAISEENSASAKEISDAVGEVATRAQEVGHSARDLHAIAEDLRGAVVAFKVEDTEPEKPGGTG